MSTTLFVEPSTPFAPLHPGERLRKATIGTRVSYHWWTARRQIPTDLKGRMAAVLNAEAASISAGKKIYNQKIHAIKAINELRTKIDAYWQTNTLPYTEHGVRLLPRKDASTFEEEMSSYARQVRAAASVLQAYRDDILADARQRLQSAFSPADYPEDLNTAYALQWSFLSTEPPNYLAQMAPDVYAKELERLQARMNESLAQAEAAFTQEFSQLVQTLADRLTPNPDGSKKIFRDSAVSNFTEFFNRFRKLNVNNNQNLEDLIHQAEELLSCVQPQELRNLQLLRKEVQSGMADIAQALEPLLQNAPRRRRRRLQPEGTSCATPSSINVPTADDSSTSSSTTCNPTLEPFPTAPIA